MIYFFEECGLITRRASIPFSDAAFMAAPGEQWVQSEMLVDDATHFVLNGALTMFPPSPGNWWEWDWLELEWRIPPGALDAARAAQAAAVDRLRAERHEQPITYAGCLFDADSAARENISGVFARLDRGDGLTAGWIGWRAFDNNMVWADEPAGEVLSHLRGLSCAIEDRKQALLSVAWGHKDAISALETVEAILAYDITTGWPE